MRTEEEIKEAVNSLNRLEKLGAITDREKHGRDVLLWVLGKNFNETK